MPIIRLYPIGALPKCVIADRCTGAGVTSCQLSEEMVTEPEIICDIPSFVMIKMKNF